MPALIDIRRRIRSVKSTQKVTRAMKMVSAAKLRRAQDAIFAARPFARKMMEVLNRMASRADPHAHPLLEDRGEGKVLAVVITADKGLCGAFNANIIRTVSRFLAERSEVDVSFSFVGRKGRDFFRRRQVKIRSEHVGVYQALRFETAREIAADLIDAFTSGDVDRVFLVHNEFKSVIQQPLVVDRVLPIERHEIRPEDLEQDYLYEPAPATIFEDMLPRHVEMQVWRALLESVAAEHGARMTAMDAATNNATDLIDRLTLHMNKVRQAAITKEIIEVVSGAGSAS
ncbi:MAG: ATP synthase F1 subunit gamma [Acidobacteria bacterium]|jgi:F-type H+-transporting ATPase subunit gamma|nr:ATP synthase F1 subunit gamma [Acidobacteriota bacterium]